MMGGEAMLAGALLCVLAAPLLLLGVIYVAVRGWRRPAGDGTGKARAALSERLARGDIDVDDYYERESALRSSVPAARRRRRLL